MKKIVLFFAFFLIAVAIGLGIYGSQNETQNSDLLRQNIEALSQTKYVYYEKRKDYYDAEHHCYQQCVLDGKGCAYAYNYEYAC